MMRPPHEFDSVVMELYQGLSDGTIVLEKPSGEAAKLDFLQFGQLSTSAVGHVAVLTPREREILRLLAEGLTSAEASKALGIGVKDVEEHCVSILRKLRAAWL